MTPAAPAAAAFAPARAAGGRVVRAVFFAFVLWIPIETVYFFRREEGQGGLTAP